MHRLSLFMRSLQLNLYELGGVAVICRRTHRQTHCHLSLSGSADISGLTPNETRSGTAYFGAEGLLWTPTDL